MQVIASHDAKNNPRDLWSLVKSRKHDAIGVAPLYVDGDDHCSDPLSIASILDKHFQSVFINEDFSTIPRPNRS